MQLYDQGTLQAIDSNVDLSISLYRDLGITGLHKVSRGSSIEINKARYLIKDI